MFTHVPTDAFTGEVERRLEAAGYREFPCGDKPGTLGFLRRVRNPQEELGIEGDPLNDGYLHPTVYVSEFTIPGRENEVPFYHIEMEFHVSDDDLDYRLHLHARKISDFDIANWERRLAAAMKAVRGK